MYQDQIALASASPFQRLKQSLRAVHSIDNDQRAEAVSVSFQYLGREFARVTLESFGPALRR